jgi:hypothetical protein
MFASITASQRSRSMSAKIAGRGTCIVIDENVGRGTGREQPCLTVRGCDIGRDRGHIAAGGLAQPDSGLVEFCRIAAVDDDVDAFLRQGLRAGQSQPLTGRANQRNAASCASLPELII